MGFELFRRTFNTVWPLYLGEIHVYASQEDLVIFYHYSITRVVHDVLNCILDPTFYTRYVKLPADEVPSEIETNPIFFPFFKDCLGAIDGTHIDAFISFMEHCRYRDRKGRLSQNVLAACTFDLRFCYVMAGWEGSAGDGRVFEAARMADFTIPVGKYYLADAGFPSRPDLLVPYRGVRYHLKEWGTANVRSVACTSTFCTSCSELQATKQRRAV